MAHASEIISQLRAHRMQIREVPVQIDYTEYSLAKGQSSLNSINILFDLCHRKVPQMTFKYFLVAVLIGFIFYLLLLRASRCPAQGRSSSVVVLTMLVFAIQPDWSTEVAQQVGISRGVDLLFYLSHLTLFFVAFVYFLKFKKMEARLTKLVRQLALDRARANP